MISTLDYLYYVDVALGGMTGIVAGLGDELANRRPEVPGVNAPYAILTHCIGVMEYWGGQVIAVRAITRDRDAEFVARGEVRARDAETPMARTQGGAALHIYEELAQHHGQMELTRDLLRAG
ncbi:MAG TPA: hypothetical protein VGL93_04035 [Streptosporangiaceae bacterium]|jgi:hypothetical protein